MNRSGVPAEPGTPSLEFLATPPPLLKIVEKQGEGGFTNLHEIHQILANRGKTRGGGTFFFARNSSDACLYLGKRFSAGGRLGRSLGFEFTD